MAKSHPGYSAGNPPPTRRQKMQRYASQVNAQIARMAGEREKNAKAVHGKPGEPDSSYRSRYDRRYG